MKLSMPSLFKVLTCVLLALTAWHYGSEQFLLLLPIIGATSMTELNDLAKDYWSNVYVQLVNPETVLKGQFSKLENAQFTGRKWIFGVKTAIGGGSANARANKTLPAATQGTYDQGEENVIRTYTRMALDGLALEVTKKKDGSYRPALAEMMGDRMQAHDLEVNRQMWSDGKAQVALLLTDGGTTQTLEKDYGVANGGLGTRHMNVGDVLQPYSQADVARTKCTVTAVDPALVTITVTPDPVTTAGDYFARATADDDNHLAGEAKGVLAGIAASGTLHNIPGTFPWVAVRLHNSGTLRPISDSLVMQAIEQTRARSRTTPNLAATRPGVILKYSELFLPLVRIDGQAVKLKAGYIPVAAITHGGGQAIPVVTDLDCPSSRLFLINTSGIKLADVVGSEWADMDGATFDRITAQDGIEGYIRKYWNLIWTQRNAHAVIEDVEDVVIERAA